SPGVRGAWRKPPRHARDPGGQAGLQCHPATPDVESPTPQAALPAPGTRPKRPTRHNERRATPRSRPSTPCGGSLLAPTAQPAAPCGEVSPPMRVVVSRWRVSHMTTGTEAVGELPRLDKMTLKQIAALDESVYVLTLERVLDREDRASEEAVSAFS